MVAFWNHLAKFLQSMTSQCIIGYPRNCTIEINNFGSSKPHALAAS